MGWKHEKRGKPTKKIGRIGVAQVSTVDMHGCMEITGNDLCQAANVKKHAIKELQQVQWFDQYKRWFASLHGSACRFKQAIPYRHNQGAVSWVRLEEPKKTRTTLTSDGPPPPRDWLGGCWRPCVASAASAPSDSCTSSWCCFGMCGLVGWVASSQVASIGKIVSKQSKIDTNLVTYFEEEKTWWFPFVRISIGQRLCFGVAHCMFASQSDLEPMNHQPGSWCAAAMQHARDDTSRDFSSVAVDRQLAHPPIPKNRMGLERSLYRPSRTRTETKKLSSNFLFKFCQLITHDLSVNACPDRTTLRRTSDGHQPVPRTPPKQCLET